MDARFVPWNETRKGCSFRKQSRSLKLGILLTVIYRCKFVSPNFLSTWINGIRYRRNILRRRSSNCLICEIKYSLISFHWSKFPSLAIVTFSSEIISVYINPLRPLELFQPNDVSRPLYANIVILWYFRSNFSKLDSLKYLLRRHYDHLI